MPGVWNAVSGALNASSIYAFTRNVAQWPNEGYLFDMPDMPVIKEVNAQGDDLYIKDWFPNSDDNNGPY